MEFPSVAQLEGNEDKQCHRHAALQYWREERRESCSELSYRSSDAESNFRSMLTLRCGPHSGVCVSHYVRCDEERHSHRMKANTEEEWTKQEWTTGLFKEVHVIWIKLLTEVTYSWLIGLHTTIIHLIQTQSCLCLRYCLKTKGHKSNIITQVQFTYKHILWVKKKWAKILTWHSVVDTGPVLATVSL